jgi:hypothetical protein
VDFEEDDDSERYGRARRMLPGLLGSGQKREKFLAAVTGCALVFTGYMWLRTNAELAAVKAEKSQGWVVVLDGNGNQVQLPVASANEWRLSDGMVLDRLSRTIRCMHGLDGVPKVAIECWTDAAKLFYGVDAVAKYDAFHKERFPKVDDVLRQLQERTITVDVESWSKPEPNAPNRYWLRWKRTSRPHGSGTSTTETWSGTFDIELIPVQRTETSGMHIVRWEWHQDLSGSASKGAG